MKKLGSYCGLSVNGIKLFCTKNTYNRTYLNLFSPMDYTEYVEVIDGEQHEQYTLRTSVKAAKRRLEILGCNEKRLRDYFEKGLNFKKSERDESEEYEDYKYDEINYYKDLTFERYIDAIKIILSTQDIDFFCEDFFEKNKVFLENRILKALAEKMRTGYYLSPFFYDEIYENEEYLIDQLFDIYICLFDCPEDYVVECNLSDIVNGGWIEPVGILKYYDDFRDTTIIITEGKTDINVLSKSIDILFPEYKHLFTFFDFESYRADGGTSYLTKLIKSLSAAKIKNRIIAIFDNDTAAEAELFSIKDIPILESIRIMKLPELEFCNSYPTTGPIGSYNSNINGQAVSIELFFGSDIIATDGNYTPIRWTNYNEKIAKYQGSIERKSEIITKFEYKLNNPNLDTQDWNQLIILWETVFNQFSV